MRAPAAAQIYTALLGTSPLLPAPTLRAVFTFAERENEMGLLATLAQRPDTPVDVVERLTSMPDQRISGALLRRVTLPGATKTRQVERRAGVLATALRAQRPDAATFEDAFAAYLAKPTATLASALLALPPTWFTPAQASALLLGMNHRPVSDSGVVAALAARLGREEADLLLPQLTDLVTILWVARHDVGADAAAAAGKNALAVRRDGSPTLGSAFGPALEAVVSYRTREQGLAIAAELEPLVGRNPWAAARLADAKHLAGRRTPTAWDLSPACGPTRATDYTDADEQVVAAAAASSDPTVLPEIVDQVTRGGQVNAAGAKQLLRNRALPRLDLFELLGRLGASDWTKGQFHELADLDVVHLYRDDPLVVAMWAEMFPVDVLRRHGWAPFGGPDKAVEMIRRWVNQTDLGLRPPHTRQLMAAAYQAGLTREQLLELSCPLVLELLRPPPSGESVCGDEIGALLADELGTDPQAWAVFESACTTWHGTLGELLTAAAGVTA